MLATGFKEDGWLCESRPFQRHSPPRIVLDTLTGQSFSRREASVNSYPKITFFSIKSLFPVGFTLELYCSFSFPLSISPTLVQHVS